MIVSRRKPKEGLQETEKRDKIAVSLPPLQEEIGGKCSRTVMQYVNRAWQSISSQLSPLPGGGGLYYPLVAVTLCYLSLCDYEHHMMQQGGLKEATISLQRRQV